MLDELVGIVKFAPAAIVRVRMNTTRPLFTSVPPFMGNGASNCSVPSKSTTVIVPPVCVNAAPLMRAMLAGMSGLGRPLLTKPVSTSIVPSRIQAVEKSSVEL